MYLKCQRPINPKFSLCQLHIRANSKNKTEDLHCVKSAQIRRFFWSVFFRIPTEYGVFGHSSHSVGLLKISFTFSISSRITIYY